MFLWVSGFPFCAAFDDSRPPIFTNQASFILGTDSGMIETLNSSTDFLPLPSKKRKFPSGCTSASASAKQAQPEPGLPLTSSYGGFRDPDFFSDSGYTPKVIVGWGWP